MGQVDGTTEDFLFGSLEQARVRVGQFAALGRSQQLINVLAQGLIRRVSR